MCCSGMTDLIFNPKGGICLWLRPLMRNVRNSRFPEIRGKDDRPLMRIVSNSRFPQISGKDVRVWMQKCGKLELIYRLLGPLYILK